MKALLLVLGGIVAFNVVTIAGLAVSEIRDRRRRGLEVRYLETLWHVDRPHLLLTRRVERSLARGPSRPWGGRPLGIAFLAVTIFAGTALASTGARKMATSVLTSVAEELGLQPAEAEVSAAADERYSAAGLSGDARDIGQHRTWSPYDPPSMGVPSHATGSDGLAADETGSPTTPSEPGAIPLAGPTTPVAVPVSSSQVDLNWVDVSGETAFRIERSGDGASWAPLGTTEAGVTSYKDVGLSPGTTYAYRVVAVYPTGEAPSDGVTVTTLVDPPAATTLSAEAVSSTQVSLTWVDVPTETSYRIERSLDGATGWTTVVIVDQNVTSYTDGGLSAATTYSYRVVAVNEAGGNPSNVSQVSTPSDAPGTASEAPAA
ncbi:MAG: fibronectin type III domain-containing protein [Actinomycetota bacterium]